MYISDLVCNPEFEFNAPFRILHYVMDSGIASEEAERITTVFDSEKDADLPPDLALKHISAINTGDDGILEIEYVDLLTDNYWFDWKNGGWKRR